MVSAKSVGQVIWIHLFISFATCVQGYQAIPTDNLSYPVLLNLKDHGMASGFYLGNDTDLYLVTARHVLFIEPNDPKIIEMGPPLRLKSNFVTCISYPTDPNDPNRIEIGLDLKSLNDKKQVRYHKTSDAAIVVIGTKHDAPTGKWRMFKEAIVKSGTSVLKVDVSNTVTFDRVLVSNDVFVFGYPVSIGLKQMPQIEYDRPLLRKGIVAGRNQSQKTIIIDCPTYYGNSGGPVVQVEYVDPFKANFRVIGLVSQFVPFAETWRNMTHGFNTVQISNSGYSVVTPIDAVLELLPKEEKAGKQSQDQGLQGGKEQAG